MSPFYSPILLGSPSIAETLIRKNAVVDAVNKDGQTPLDVTAYSGILSEFLN